MYGDEIRPRLGKPRHHPVGIVHHQMDVKKQFAFPPQAFYRRRGYWLLGELPDAAKAGITELVMLKDLD